MSGISLLDGFQRDQFRGYLAMVAMPSEARVQALVEPPVLDDYGQPVETWVDVAASPAVKSPLSAIERQALGYTATDVAFHVITELPLPAITSRHRLKVDGEILDIDAVETDQTGTITRFRARKVTT